MQSTRPVTHAPPIGAHGKTLYSCGHLHSQCRCSKSHGEPRRLTFACPHCLMEAERAAAEQSSS